MKYLLSFFCSVAMQYVIAQPPKTYAETQREKDNATYNKNYIEGTKYNRNLPSNSSGTVNPNAAKELQEQFNRNKQRYVAPAPVQQGVVTGGGLIGGEMSWNQVQALKKKEEQKEAEILEVQRTFYKKGFTAEEALNLGRIYKEGEYNWEDADFRKEYFAYFRKMLSSVEEFNNSKATESYAKLKKLVNDFVAAGYTSMKAKQYLATRFPDKKEELERSELLSINHFYGGHQYFNLEQQYTVSKQDRKDEVSRRFFELYEIYKDDALIACKGGYEHYSPIKEKMQSAIYASNTADQIKWGEIGMRIPYGDNWRYVVNFYYDPLLRIPGYFKSKPSAYWLELSRLQKIPVMDIISGLSHHDYNNLMLLQVFKSKYETEISPEFKKEFLPVVLELADAGEASALNAKAILIASGNVRKTDKKDAFPFLLQAANKGNIYAQVNLLNSPDWDIKNAPSAEEVITSFQKFAATATGEQLFYLYKTINYSNGGKRKQEKYNLSKLLCEESARLGYGPAKNEVAERKW